MPQAGEITDKGINIMIVGGDGRLWFHL